jgi:hypothetical protein
MRLAAMFAVAFGFSAQGCARNGDARLVTSRDTVTVVGPDWVPIPVKVVGGDGRDLDVPDFTVSLSSDTAVRARRNSIACLRSGSATVKVEWRDTTATIVARCRLGARFRLQPFLAMMVGDSAQRVTAIATYPDGESETLRDVGMAIADTGIARFHEGGIIPVGVGRTRVRYDLGGASVRGSVVVHQLIAEQVVTLEASERQAWKLGAGLYTITVTPTTKGERTSPLRIETDGLGCARHSSREDSIHCLAKVAGRLDLVNDGGRPGARPGSAAIRIERIPQ